MPIAFLHNVATVKGVNTNSAEKNHLSYVNLIESEVNDDVSNDFNLTLDIDIKLRKVSSGESSSVQITKEPDALKVSLYLRKTFARNTVGLSNTNNEARKKILGFLY